MLEIPPSVSVGLAEQLAGSVFLRSDATGEIAELLASAANREDTFAIETRSLELAARALLPRRRAERPMPGWLRCLAEELTPSGGVHSGPSSGRCSLEMAARRYEHHRCHVARAFREWFGRSLGSHVRAWRLVHGADRLASTDQPIGDIAFDLGFSDQAHFTRAFRLRYGDSPLRYRRSHRVS